mmetsp:Transcript_55759/g.103135  ORF Transcript_55759/g.103135 Transcript_55759/m.103135 type:complete len:190 (+) Transcript_55759:116-685(+)
MLGETFQLTPRHRCSDIASNAEDLASVTSGSDSPKSRMRMRFARMLGEAAVDHTADEEPSPPSTPEEQHPHGGAVAEMWHQMLLQDQTAQPTVQRHLEPQIPAALPVRPLRRPASASAPRRHGSRPQSASHRWLRPADWPQQEPRSDAAPTVLRRRPQSAATPRRTSAQQGQRHHSKPGCMPLRPRTPA